MEFLFPISATIAMKAALLIQQWYRRYLARMEIKKRYTWTIFQSIEYAGEQDQIQVSFLVVVCKIIFCIPFIYFTWIVFILFHFRGKLYNFFNALLTHIPDATNRPYNSMNVSRASSNGKEVWCWQNRIGSVLPVFTPLKIKIISTINVYTCVE